MQEVLRQITTYYTLYLYFLISFLDVQVTAEKLSACSFSTDPSVKVTSLPCNSDTVIELSQVLVGYSSNSGCLADYCPLHEVSSPNKYFDYLHSTCQHQSTCELSSNELYSNFSSGVFEVCGHASRIRNIVKVVYRCVFGESIPTAKPAAIFSSSAANSANSAGISTLPATTAMDTPADGASSHQTPITTTAHPASGGQTDKIIEDLTVKIVAPILGFLTVVALIVLVICLKKKRLTFRSTKKDQPDQRNTYEDVTCSQQEHDETYYSEPGHGSLSPQAPGMELLQVVTHGITGAPGKVKRGRVNGHEVEVIQNDSLTDDGFYDTVSDDDDDRDPCTGYGSSDVYAEIQKDDAVTPVTVSPHQPTAEGNQILINNVYYEQAEPVYQQDVYSDQSDDDNPVLIVNDVYEHTDLRGEQEYSAPAGDQCEHSVTEFVENDLYSTS